MTPGEFAQGWRLLILQPWGWRYKTMIDGKPSEESKSQLEFYYTKLAWAHHGAWMKVAEMYAQGDEWPSITALKRALQDINYRYVGQLTDARSHQYEPMPEEVSARIMKGGDGKERP